MLDKRAQGLSINVIVAAVIGLIIIVVVVMLLTGKLGGFSKGVDESNSCVNACKSLGKTTGAEDAACTGKTKFPGNFKEGSNCCCT